MKKLVFDQLVYAPFIIFASYSSLTLLNDGTIKEVKNKCKTLFKDTYTSQCIIWIPTQYINFKYLNLYIKKSKTLAAILNSS